MNTKWSEPYDPIKDIESAKNTIRESTWASRNAFEKSINESTGVLTKDEVRSFENFIDEMLIIIAREFKIPLKLLKIERLK